MRLSLRRGMLAATAGVVLLSCVDAPTAPRATAPVLSGGHVRTALVGSAKVVISQVYGAGGNAGALAQNDYVELFNAGTAPASLAGWSVQYASATGTGNFGASSSQLVVLSGSIAPGQYYLVKLSGGTTGAVLPTADVTGTINMSGTAGKVALADQPATLGCNGGSTPCDATQLAHIIDLVGFGNANYFEGTAAAPTISSTLADFRADHGCTDTNRNSVDFATGAPAPRNSATPMAPCGGPVIGPLDHVVVTGGTSVNLGSTVTLSAALQDAANNAISDPSATFTWASADEATAHIVSSTGNSATIEGLQVGGPVTITVTATSNAVTTSATPAVTVIGVAVLVPSTTLVSELHYDNALVDAGEAMEIEGDAGASLDGWNLVLYNGSAGSSSFGVYSTIALSGVIPATCGARGVVVVSTPGLQNGEADGWALVNALGQVTELKSYEGTFTATTGPAGGLTSVAIDADEATPAILGRSVQRAGNGVWFGPRTNTFGACNPALPLGPQGNVVISSGKPELAFGMQTQFFYGGTDLTGQPVTSVVWSTSNPSVIIVDQKGVVTAKGVGSAQLIATAPDGANGTTDVSVHLAAGSTGIRLGHNTEFGEPKDADLSDDFLIRRAQYTVSYNPRRGGANWVSWNLDASHIGGSGRCPDPCYSADTALSNAGLPAYTTADWVSGATYDRGHMAPSADWTASEADNNTTFFLSNFLPQAPDNNQGPWERLEAALRDSVAASRGSREAYIIAGGIFTNGVGLGTLLNLGKVAIPDSTWKIAVITPAGAGLNADGTLPANTTVLVVNMPNVQGIRGIEWPTYLSTVAKIEASTGYNFLELIAESVQCRVEQRNCAPIARVTSDISGNGWQANEGQTVAFSGTASSDPDPDDVLGMTWSVDGANAGTGSTFSHTFANDGTYQVQLTVTDPQGATSTTTVVVVVQNVAPVIGNLAGATILRGETYAAAGSFTDPGADVWTALVNYGDGSGTSPLALGEKDFALSHTYTATGAFAVVVSVNDGTSTTTRSATVVVRTTAEGIAALDTAVMSLPLNKGQVNSLQVKLQAAAKQLAAGNATPGVNILNAFIEELRATMQSGRVSEATGTPIVDYALRLIASISAP